MAKVDPTDRKFLDRFLKWLPNKSLAEQKNGSKIHQERSSGNHTKRAMKLTRPRRWEEVEFNAVPLLEDELGVMVVVNESLTDAKAPIPDPLGLQEIDLRVAEELYAGEVLRKRQEDDLQRARQNLAPGQLSSADPADLDLDEEPEDETSRSVLPIDKNFCPVAFLTFIHGNVTFAKLMQGARHLEGILDQQSSRRVNIVRGHFGLFVLCAEGLEWLKLVRSSANEASTDDREARGLGSIGDRLLRTQAILTTARQEALNTLAPLLQRHKRSRELRKAEIELRNISTIVEVPQKMQRAFEAGNYEEVVAIYGRVSKLAKARVKTDSDVSALIISRVKEKADNILIELKSKCEGSTRSVGDVPNVETIVKYWSVRCSFEAALLETEALDPELEVQYLRASFDDHLAYFLGKFKAIFVQLKEKGAQALLTGEAIDINAVTAGVSAISTRYDAVLTKEERNKESDLNRRRVAEQEERDSERDEDEDDGNETNSALFSGGVERDLDLARGGLNDEDHDDVDRQLDFTRTMCFELRVSSLQAAIDLLASWLNSLYSFAVIIFTRQSQVGRRQGVVNTRPPTTTVLAREVQKISNLCISLLKGMSEASSMLDMGEGVFDHSHFLTTVTSKYGSAAYDEIFALSELLSSLQYSSAGSAIMKAKPLFSDAVSQLNAVTLEGEQLAASAALRSFSQKVTSMLISLEKSLEATEEVDKVASPLGLISKSAADFELLALRTLRKIYAGSNRPDCIADVVTEGLMKGCQMIIAGLNKIILQVEYESSSATEEALAVCDNVLDGVNAFLKEADPRQEEAHHHRLFETMRACLQLRLISLPKMVREIRVKSIDVAVVVSRRGSGDRRRLSTLNNNNGIGNSKSESERVASVQQSLLKDLAELLLGLESAVVVRYLELKSTSLRRLLSSRYYNLVAGQQHSINNSDPLTTCPLVTLALALIDEKRVMNAIFSSGGNYDSEDPSVPVKVSCFGSTLFTELCKRMASFYIGLVSGLFTGTIQNTLCLPPNKGISLLTWSCQSLAIKKTAAETSVPNSAPRLKPSYVPAVPPSCPYPALFEQAYCESIFLSDLAQRLIENERKRSSSFPDEYFATSIPQASIQIRLEPEAYGVHATKNIFAAKDRLEKALLPLNLLLI